MYYFLINVHVNTSRTATTDLKEAGTAMHPPLPPSPCTAGLTNKSNAALAQRLKKSFTPSKSQLKNTKGFIYFRFICFPIRTLGCQDRHTAAPRDLSQSGLSSAWRCLWSVGMGSLGSWCLLQHCGPRCVLQGTGTAGTTDRAGLQC